MKMPRGNNDSSLGSAVQGVVFGHTEAGARGIDGTCNVIFVLLRLALETGRNHVVLMDEKSRTTG